MTIVVAPLHELAGAMERWEPAHLVSLGSPGGPAAPTFNVDTLTLTFHDIIAPREGLTMANIDQVAALIALARRWHASAPLLIHCWAGVSRSPAAAYVVACARSAPGEECGIADRLRHAAPFATPNPHIVALADTLLGRDGRMIGAIGTIGRGAEVALGHSFRLATA